MKSIALLFVTLAALALAFVELAAFAVEPTSATKRIKSGLEIGEQPEMFQVRDVTGPAAGKTLCYYCRYGPRPVVCVFTRGMNDDVAALIKQFDRAVDAHRANRMAAFVVYLGKDTAEIEQRMKNVASEQSVRRTPLTIYKDKRQRLHDEFKISDDAAVTVMMWSGGRVRASHAYATATLDEQEIDRLLSATARILPKKKN